MNSFYGIFKSPDDPDFECVTFNRALPFSITGEAGNTPNLKDLVLDKFPPVSNCGSLKVEKSITGGDDFGASFPITVDGPGDDIPGFSLGDGDPSPTSSTITDLPAGDTYSVTEVLTGLPPGWSIDSISCDDTTSTSTGTGVTTLSGITVVAGQTTTCTVTNTPERPDLTIVKQVVNDDGGAAAATDFTVRSNGTARTLVDETPDSDFDSQASVTLSDVAPGDYTITEDAFSGYTNTSITCDDANGGSTATLALGGSATCTVVNDDDPASLTLEKIVQNDDGGSATVDNFDPTVSYDGTGDASGVTTSPDWDTYDVPAGEYTVGEQDAAGSSYLVDGDYIMTSIKCDGQETDTITLGNGDSGTCTITNTDVPPGLTVVKVVHNDHGGELGATDFPLTVNSDTVTTGVAETFPAGDYTIAETQQNGYKLEDTYCTRDGQDVAGISGESFDISVGLNEEVVCTFVNRDIPARVTLVKTVTNDDGGDLENTDFPVTLDDDTVAWDTEYDVDAGDHTVGETQQDGYTTTGWGTDCSSGEDPTQGSFTAELDTDYTCTITNDDQPATVTLVKTVVNDDGGTLKAGDFPAFVDSSPVTWEVAQAIDAGPHTASETQQGGYEAGDWGGDCAADGSLDAEIGGAYTCTITNDDIAPTIVLRKTVVNDDGGTLEQDDFPSFLDDDPLAWDTSIDSIAGPHTVSETQQPGYTAEGWGGDCAADGSLTMEIGGAYECTITNDDVPGTLTLYKKVVNDNGRTAVASDFTPAVNPDPLVEQSFTFNAVGATEPASYDVPAGSYNVTEAQPPSNYTLTGVACYASEDVTDGVPNGEARPSTRVRTRRT